MSRVPFVQRFGLDQSKPIDNDIPRSARVALAHLIADLTSKEYLEGSRQWNRPVLDELFRCGRFTSQDFEFEQSTPFLEVVVESLARMEWWQVYTFFERVYERLLIAVGYFEEKIDEWVETVTLSDVREYYTDELNIILAEENIAYHFVNGQFQRRGRAQTQKSIQRVGMVLTVPALSGVRNHYNRARQFFDERPEPDTKNCIKEALCALEACLEVLTDKPASKNFTKILRQLQGNEPRQVPSPIVEGMIKLHAYRGSGQGVAHAALGGSKVSELEAELVLNLVASYITYLVDLLSQPQEEIPF
ncbi:MAG: hypothetical protein H8D43_04615 [Chloroflexi bacterium]|nr:hypothetical protein [Chloroflexota bacterium]